MWATHYGVWDGGRGVRFLLQRRGWSNAIGIRDLNPPIEVRPMPARCPHDIDLYRLSSELPDWVDHPFVKAFHPTPREGKVHAILNRDGVYDDLIWRLTHLSSPVEPLVLPIWGTNPSLLIKQLLITNVSPLVVCGVDVRHLHRVIRLLEVPSPRRLILVCSERLPAERMIEHVEPTDLETPDQVPVGAIGATILARWMRQ